MGTISVGIRNETKATTIGRNMLHILVSVAKRNYVFGLLNEMKTTKTADYLPKYRPKLFILVNETKPGLTIWFTKRNLGKISYETKRNENYNNRQKIFGPLPMS